MRALVLVCCVLLTGGAVAAPVTIDFEEYAGWEPSQLPGLSTKGFDISWVGGGNFALDTFGAFDSHSDGVSLFFCPTCAASEGIRLTASNGALFSLLSFDSGWLVGESGVITVTGTFADSSTVVLPLLDGGDWFSSTVLDASWTGLQSVTFEGVNTSGDVFNSLGLDNIVVAAVPLPAAVWLFVSALAGAGLLRRSKPSS